MYCCSLAIFDKVHCDGNHSSIAHRGTGSHMCSGCNNGNQKGVDHVGWLDSSQATMVLEALKGWCGRYEVNYGSQ